MNYILKNQSVGMYKFVLYNEHYKNPLTIQELFLTVYEFSGCIVTVKTDPGNPASFYPEFQFILYFSLDIDLIAVLSDYSLLKKRIGDVFFTLGPIFKKPITYRSLQELATIGGIR